MRRLLAGVLLSVSFALACPSLTTAGAGDEALARLLIKKGILTQEDYEALRKEIEGAAPPAPAPAAPPRPAPPAARQPAAPGMDAETVALLIDRLRDDVREELRRRDVETVAVGARLDTEVRFRSHRDVGDRRSRSTSETYIRAAEVDLAARPLSWLQGSLVLKSEYSGADTTNQNQPADPAPFLDEATLTLKDPEFPLYAVIGKRRQPFGAFFGDERWATDPMSKEAYEINEPGLTVGFFRKFFPSGLELDLSATVYRQEEQIDHLFASGLFDSATVVRSTSLGRTERDQLNSFIVAASVTPNRFLNHGIAFLTEPGDGSRNQSLAAWVSHTWFGRLTTEVEFMSALTRERYVRLTTLDDGSVASERLGQAFKEKVLTLGLAYRPLRGLLIGGRYEHFWDDGLADAAEAWSVRHRGSVAASYTLFERGDISARIIGEYRLSDIHRGGVARSMAAPDQNELFGKFSVIYK
jgi:hypothetical protein